MEPEPPEAISARKLVLESGKFNVITAYSGKEALETLKTFPKVSAVVVHCDLHDISCERLVEEVKRQDAQMRVIVLCPSVGYRCKGAEYNISSHSPEQLLQLVREIFGDPRSIAA